MALTTQDSGPQGGARGLRFALASLLDFRGAARPYPWRTHCLMLTPLLLAVLLAGLPHSFWGESVRLAMAALRDAHPVVTAGMKLISDWSSKLLSAVYGTMLIRAWLKGDTDTRAFVLRWLLAVAVVTFALTYLLKAGFGLPRPGFPLPPQPFSFMPSYSSFPSGHTATIISAAVPLGLWLGKRRWQIALALLIAAVGWSRLWLGAHHPVDLLGGMVMGSLAARAVFWGGFRR